MTQQLPFRATAATLLLALLTGTACGTLEAAPAPTAPITAHDALQTQLQAELERAFPANEPGATALVMKDGKVVFRGAAGMANLELGVAMQS